MGTHNIDCKNKGLKSFFNVDSRLIDFGTNIIVAAMFEYDILEIQTKEEVIKFSDGYEAA